MMSGVIREKLRPLHYACEIGDAEKVTNLIENGADVNETYEDAYGITSLTPLHVCCEYGRENIARILINNKADINAQTGGGNTPLHWAMAFSIVDATDVIKLLIEHKADVNRTNKEGQTPLEDACTNLVIIDATVYTHIRMLLEAGAKPIDNPVVRKALAIIKKRHIEKHATLSDNLTSIIIR